MEYSIDKLGKLAGVTSRTLRYYDQIGLLKPLRSSSAGYRIYGPGEVDRLQQILFFRALGVELSQIKEILDTAQGDILGLLHGHLRGLEERREELERIIETVKKTIESKETQLPMTDAEKFEGFKRSLVKQNEAQYGTEIRRAHGDDTVDASNARLMGLSQEECEKMTALSEEIIALLEQAVGEGAPPEGELGRRIAEKHRQWLAYTWTAYSPEAHKALVQMYVDDPRFTVYYDKNCPGCAAFLRAAVLAAI